MGNPLAALAAPPRPALDIGVHPGVVTRITGDGAWVEVPSLVPGYEYGPCRVPRDWRRWTHWPHDHAVNGVQTDVGGAGDAAHSHGIDVTSQTTVVAEHEPDLTPGTAVTVLLHPAGHHLLARY